MNIDQLHKPVMLQIFSGTVISMIKNRTNKTQLPVQKRISHFILEKEIRKNNNSYEYTVGIYMYQNKRYFIKTWHGKIKDLHYYLLINQAIVTQVLSEKFRKLSASPKIRIPKVISIIKSKNMFSVVFEYIDGKSLNLYSSDKKATTIKSVLTAFDDLSKSLTAQERALFTTRGFIFYILTFPILWTMISIRSYKAMKYLLKNMKRIISSFISFKNQELLIAHRDLLPENILIKDKTIHVLDFERIALTVPYYDMTLLSVDIHAKQLHTFFKKYLKKRDYKSIRTYILMHLSICFYNDSLLFPYYIKQIYEK